MNKLSHLLSLFFFLLVSGLPVLAVAETQLAPDVLPTISLATQCIDGIVKRHLDVHDEQKTCCRVVKRKNPQVNEKKCYSMGIWFLRFTYENDRTPSKAELINAYYQ